MRFKTFKRRCNELLKRGATLFLIATNIKNCYNTNTKFEKENIDYEKSNQTPWGGGGIKSLKLQKAFTLAEVLITLAIIGIVAALTIPTLVSKNEEKQLEAKKMKLLNTLTNALSLSVVQNGSPDNWDLGGENTKPRVLFDKYLAPYIKVAKYCDETDILTCIPITSWDVDMIDKDADINEALAFYAENGTPLILADGISFMSGIQKDDIGVYVFFYADINGPKGPNVFGKDFIVLDYSRDENKNYILKMLED